MNWVAIRMLTGDRVKFLGLVFGIAFSTLLITQQLTLFVNLIFRGGVAVQEVSTADIWVMDPASRTADVIFPMPITALDRVRAVPGVAFASPMLRSNATIRTPDGDLEGVTVIGVDDSALIGLPRRMTEGSRERLMDPNAVFIDDTGARKLFGDSPDVVGTELELNDQRAIVNGIVDSVPTFTAQVTLYTRYSNALNYVPGTRNRLSFVLVRSDGSVTAEKLTARITDQTGLKARTSKDFTRDGVDFIVENTGIPINFGITVILGVVVGVAIVGLTLSLFLRDNIKQFGMLKAIGVTNPQDHGHGRRAKLPRYPDRLWPGLGHGDGVHRPWRIQQRRLQGFLHALGNPANHAGPRPRHRWRNQPYRDARRAEHRSGLGVQMSKTAISVSHVAKDFPVGDTSIRVLHDVSVDVQAGELTYLVGESGSGKTTLISIIAGILLSDRGQRVGVRYADL